MDDERTKQALDDLADLYLTGISPDGQTVRKTSDPLDAPAPIRLKPKLSPGSAPVPGSDPSEAEGKSQQQQQLDAVTGAHRAANGRTEEAPFLRLTDDEESKESATAIIAPPEPQPMLGAQVEAVLLGNLPGVSGPWLQQYAQLLSDQNGPVALLHVAGERIELELVEPKNAVGKTRPVIEMGQSSDRRPAIVALLEALVRAGQSAVTSVLVHVEPALDGTEALRLFALDDWTLLCGADDASIISAYRMLKQRAETDVTVSDKRIGLMIMGSEQSVAQSAAARIRSASESFLNTPVRLMGWQKQMVPVHVRRLGTFEGVNQVWPKLCDWFATLERPQVEQIEPAATAEGDSSPVPHPEMKKSASTAPERRPQLPRRSRIMDIPAPAKPAERPKREPASIPAPAPVTEPSAIRDSGGPPSAIPSLSALITTLPGAIALEARCPQLPGVEIVLDQRGVMHLLHREADNLQSAITELLSARQWAVEHRQLLALTQRQLKLDADAEPMLHLFTGRCEQATALVARLGDQFKLHLLRQVAVGSQSTWFCAPLN
ncbi:MAG: hypothetical protein IT445_06710 [Phycisphaeraceae bacterium]|nr:hypothetical protein [Phycisphaeraceae bacterium]